MFFKIAFALLMAWLLGVLDTYRVGDSCARAATRRPHVAAAGVPQSARGMPFGIPLVGPLRVDDSIRFRVVSFIFDKSVLVPAGLAAAGISGSVVSPLDRMDLHHSTLST
jgi:hypothetical protein